MIQKIKKAAFEGTLIRKSIIFIFTKLPIILVNMMDWFFGCLIRSVYAMFTRINRNQIMFIPFQGDYTCNPKYIADEILRRTNEFEIVFSARHASLNKVGAYPDGIKLVEQYSMDFYKQIAKSKIIIANSVEFQKKPVPLKKGQILIETWHGSLGIKRFGEKENHGRTWVAAARRNGRRANYIISNSTFEDSVYRDTFWKKTPILQYGHPRNDILFSYDSETRQNICRKVLNTEDESDYRYVLYAPTFRDDHELGYYRVDYNRLCGALSERFGGEWKVLVRLHPTVRKLSKALRAKGGNVINVTSYPDIQELMIMSDVAITDYSSWIYDFILTGRPGFIFATDIHSYEDERGFYYPLSKTPFPIAVNNDELENNILSFDIEKYSSDLSLFLKEKGCMEDGHASERVVDKIMKIMGEPK